MIVKTNLFKPKLLFLNKQHYFPNNESYILTKNINEIKNTPVIPSFGKRIIQSLTSLFHKLEIHFLIRDIKNNKLSSIIDVNKHSHLFNEIDNKINKKECEINNLPDDEKESEIRNKNLNTISKIIYHANDKFDFYSYCDYLTEVKRAKDFFSAQDDTGKEGSDNKLIVECLNEIIKSRINAINNNGIINIFKLINSKFNFENIHLNKKYDFIHNFSTEKERDNFIKSINILLIGIEEVQVLNKFDNNTKNKIENKLYTIMIIALDKKRDSEYSFDSLKQEWKEKYINDNYKMIKRNVIVDTDIPNDLETEEIIEISKKAPKKELINRYINIDNFSVGDYKPILESKTGNVNEIDNDDNSDIDNYKLMSESKIDNASEIDEDDSLDLQWDYEDFNINNVHNKKLNLDILVAGINNFTSELKSNEKFNKIINKLDLIMLDIDENPTEEETTLNLDEETRFSKDNYQLYFNKEENTHEISEESKNNKKL
ncbi:hypothetical protein [Acinetobacter baumannii]|uniref:hypothetical protein n=1 Tax=Acinetobacter baumannii TaxID=470 RepID=UPI0034CD792E